MKGWQVVALALVLWGGLRLVATPPVVGAADADAFLAGLDLASSLTAGDELGLRARLARGFEPHADNPKIPALPADAKARHAVVEAPVARWAAALGVMLAPTGSEASNLERAASGSAVLVSLALALLAGVFWRRDRVLALLGPALLLTLPGVGATAAASGPGATAAALLAMTLLVLAVEHLAPPPTGASAPPPRGGALAVAAAWALTFGLHPGAAVLLVPVFVAFALARAPSAPAPPSVPAGLLRLPLAPLGLFLVPLVGLLLLVALWPALWVETGKRLGAWVMDTGWLYNPSYEVAGVAYDQGVHRAAMGWTGLVAWAAWTPPTVLVAWLFGVVRAVRLGRRGRPFALFAWLALVLVGAADGGLWGARLDLLALLAVPTALVAAGGVAELADLWVRWRPALRRGPARFVIAAAILAVPVLGPTGPWALAPLPGVGAELRWPVPAAWLAEASELRPGALHAEPAPASWRPGVDAVCDGLSLPLRWGAPNEADWLLVAGEPAPAARDRIGGRAPFREGLVAGVPLRLYPLFGDPSLPPGP